MTTAMWRGPGYFAITALTALGCGTSKPASNTVDAFASDAGDTSVGDTTSADAATSVDARGDVADLEAGLSDADAGVDAAQSDSSVDALPDAFGFGSTVTGRPGEGCFSPMTMPYDIDGSCDSCTCTNCTANTASCFADPQCVILAQCILTRCLGLDAPTLKCALSCAVDMGYGADDPPAIEAYAMFECGATSCSAQCTADDTGSDAGAEGGVDGGADAGADGAFEGGVEVGEVGVETSPP